MRFLVGLGMTALDFLFPIAYSHSNSQMLSEMGARTMNSRFYTESSG